MKKQKNEEKRSRSPQVRASRAAKINAVSSSRVQKAEVADDIKDPDESELKTYDNITLMSRNFTFKGRVMFKTIGEIAQSGQLKMQAEVEEESGKRVDLFALGNGHKAKWARVQYNDCVEVTGLKMQKSKTSAYSESPGKKNCHHQKDAVGKPWLDTKMRLLISVNRKRKNIKNIQKMKWMRVIWHRCCHWRTALFLI